MYIHFLYISISDAYWYQMCIVSDIHIASNARIVFDIRIVFIVCWLRVYNS